MRLVSQNGNVDIPYDKAILLHAQDYVMARIGDKEYLMGEYSSMEKSYRAMEMLRITYLNNEYYKSLCNGIAIPLPNNLDDMKEKTMATRAFRETTIFQFPKDEEVEV